MLLSVAFTYKIGHQESFDEMIKLWEWIVLGDESGLIRFPFSDLTHVLAYPKNHFRKAAP